jgi:hypothetical protein
MSLPLIQKSVDRSIEQAVIDDFLIFLLEKWRISSGEHKGEKFSLSDRPYLLDIITSKHRNRATMKSAQCGISEEESARAVWKVLPPKKGNVLYTFPAGEQMQQFVDARIREAVMNNDYLADRVTGSLNLKKFSIGHNQIYFRGAQKRRQIISVDVSDAFLDEVDEYEEGVEYTITKRLGAALNPSISRFSTPSFHGIGISLTYYGSEDSSTKGSDQQVWSIKCPHCNQWNKDLEWENNVLDLNDKDIKFSHYTPNTIIVCRKCKKEINRLEIDNALWIAKFPSLTEHCEGRHVSKLFAPGTNLNQMMLDSKDPLKEQEFFNSDLGLPYEPKGSRLTDAVIDKARGIHQLTIISRVSTNIGVDIGPKKHVIASVTDDNGRNKIIGIEACDTWDDVGHFFSEFHGRSAVIDLNPEKDEAIDFQKKHDNCRIRLAYFAQHLERTKEKYIDDTDKGMVGIHRTYMMMLESDLIHSQDIIFPIDLRQVKNFYAHLKSPIKAQKEDLTGNMITYYPKTNQPDHYYFALLYNIVASMMKPRPSIFRIVQTMMS